MKTLMLNPNSRKEDSVDEIPLLTPPINLMYAAQSLHENGFKTEILDSFALNMSDKKVLEEVKKKDYDNIAIPLYSCDLTKMHYFTQELKEHNPNINIIFAGHHASTLPHTVMKQFPKVDYIVRGEGEFSTVQLMQALEKNNDTKTVGGITYRHEGKIKHNTDNKLITDLDTVPIPSRSMINQKLYYSKMSKRSKVDVIITSRGCPYKCTFCAKLTDEFRSFRQRSTDNIIEELSHIQDQGTNAVEIYDEIFTIKRKHAINLATAMKKEGLDFEFRIRTRATHVDHELLKTMKSAGCSTVSYGVESADQRVLDTMKKETTPRIVEQAFKTTEKNNINVLGFFMIGNKGDTPVTIRKTINFAKK